MTRSRATQEQENVRPEIPTTETNDDLKVIKGLTHSTHEQVNADMCAAVRAVLVARAAEEYVSELDKWRKRNA